MGSRSSQSFRPGSWLGRRAGVAAVGCWPSGGSSRRASSGGRPARKSNTRCSCLFLVRLVLLFRAGRPPDDARRELGRGQAPRSRLCPDGAQAPGPDSRGADPCRALALNLTNQRSFYVLVSRAKDGVTIATSDRAGLIAAIRERSGEQQTALDQLEARLAPVIAQTAMQQTAQEQQREQQQLEQQRERTMLLAREREATDDGKHNAKPGGRDADLGQERGNPSTNRQRDHDDDLGY